MTAADRYVTTTSIRQAVAGREGEILDLLGINWRVSGHISCPYPDHDDKHPSWRWDERARKARCSCTPKGASIHDVAMKVRGLADFEAAKIAVAELLRRDDLIVTKKGAGQFQKTDAYSLLHAPAERREDDLPIAYLAHRLGVPSPEVPVPSTAIAGLKTLGYFDPPAAGSKAKPKLVGNHPCAVFRTVAADGRDHAHRIYLAPAGAGKADLGEAGDRPRDPKKSARIIGDGKVGGCAVLWGETGAPHIVVAEGIETGAAVALAFKSEIAEGLVMVAAAISAGGIEAFLTYPATTRVTVAADRDEAPKSDGRPSSHAGEKAARAFALKHYTGIAVDIALPGNAGETVDWLDILRRDGIQTAHNGIAAATLFAPTQDELDGAAETARRLAETLRIAGIYPLPDMQTSPLTYACTPDGRVLAHKVVARKNQATGRVETELEPISTPFGVPARLRFIDREEYGLRVLVEDMSGRPRPLDFDRGDLAKMAAAEIRSMLFAAGLRTHGDGELSVVAALKAADPATEIAAVRSRGWHRIAGHADPIFVAPDGAVYGATDGGLQLELSAAARMPPDVARGGDFEGWRAAVGAAVSAANCQHWGLGLLAGFAGCLAALAELPTCGVNLSGQSSSGKSLAQEIAVSVWGKPDLTAPGSLLQSARATDNAFEGQAARATGTILALDELAHVVGKGLAKIVYTLAGEVGKTRMRSDSTLRPSYTWKTFALFSNEVGLAEKIRDDGGTWLPGMATRFADVDVDGLDRKVARATIEAIQEVRRHYGHAGPAFALRLIESGGHRQPASLRQAVGEAAEKLAGAAPDSARKRAALPFGLLQVAGTLAQALGVLPDKIDVAGTVRWAWEGFGQSAEAAALDPGEEAISSIRQWILERWDLSIKDVGEAGAGYRDAVGWYDNTAVYLPQGRLHEAAGKALKETRLAKLLHDRGFLDRKPEPDRYYVRWVPGVGGVRAFALSRKEFGRDRGLEKKVDLKVHQGGRDGD